MKGKLCFLGLSLFLLATGACKYTCQYPIDMPAKFKIDPRLLGIWKMKEDTSIYDYFVIEQRTDYNFKVSYLNKFGENPQYSHFPVYYSEIAGVGFLNNTYVDNGARSYFFTRIVDIADDKLTLVMYADSMIHEALSPDSVRMTIQRHLNDPSYFRDTFHFRKVFGFSPCVPSMDSLIRYDQVPKVKNRRKH